MTPEEETKLIAQRHKNRTTAAWFATGFWVIIGFTTLTHLLHTGSYFTQPGEVGDFFAGLMAPVAFLIQSTAVSSLTSHANVIALPAGTCELEFCEAIIGSR